jgi:hypothetical protein
VDRSDRRHPRNGCLPQIGAQRVELQVVERDECAGLLRNFDVMDVGRPEAELDASRIRHGDNTDQCVIDVESFHRRSADPALEIAFDRNEIRDGRGSGQSESDADW